MIRIVEDSGYITLKADEGKLIMHVNQSCASNQVALGCEAKESDWVEIEEIYWKEEDTISHYGIKN